MARTLASVAELAGGRLVGADAAFGTLITDSRRVEAGALFACLEGANHDGHVFVETAMEAGASGVLAKRERVQSTPRVEVDDTLASLGRFARGWRDAHAVKVAAITGSNGKTTTKNLLAAVLAQEAPTLATRGNLNTRVGLPLTLSRLDETHRYAVVELGISLPGEMAKLADIAHADAAIVTNVAPAHLEGFGDVEGVAREKGALPASLSANGLAVAPVDLPWLEAWRRDFAVRRWLTFGFDETADVHAGPIELTPAGSHFELNTPAGLAEVSLQLLGHHNVANALAAAALAIGLGVAPETIARGLAAVRAESGRMAVSQLASGTVLIDDSYNANPASLGAALETVAAFGQPVWLALGELGELGDDAIDWHERAGREAHALGVARLFALGPLASHAVKTFGEGGLAFSESDDLIARLADELPGEAILLVKGSRSARMERVVAALGGQR
jgi:UDP-N-acetylmuramoyl-tripeptide--D-alanyl-D-alanine ligase